MENSYRKNSMKLHKSIRKYARFDLKKLDELIEIDSYELIESYTNCSAKDIHATSKSKLSIAVSTHSTYNELKIYKHKTNNLYMLYSNAGDTKYNKIDYYYFVCESSGLDRENKPAHISLIKENYNITYVDLVYYKNGLQHNKDKPSLLQYNYTSKYNILELKGIAFQCNNKFYNKNGPVAFFTFSHPKRDTEIIFMKNDIIRKISNNYVVTHIEITNTNNNTKFSILKNENFTKYTYKKGDLIHKLDGCAIMKVQKGVITKEWWVNNKPVLEDIFHYEKGLEKNITKSDILKAMLFDQEYGEFLQEKFQSTYPNQSTNNKV